MPIERVAITGARGVIGNVLMEGLRDSYQVTPIDLPEHDLREYNQAVKALTNQDSVIHLAWNKRDKDNKPIDDNDGDDIDPQNLKLTRNVYWAAREAGLKRIVMASSVCVDDFEMPISDTLRPDTVTTPASFYGSSKVWIEAAGRFMAKRHGFEVACLRFGAIRTGDMIPLEEAHLWLSSQDAVGAVKAVLGVDRIPFNTEVGGRYTNFHVVSDNPGRIHDLSNPLGWQPKDRSFIEV